MGARQLGLIRLLYGAIDGLRAASGVGSAVPDFVFPFLWLFRFFVAMEKYEARDAECC